MNELEGYSRVEELEDALLAILDVVNTPPTTDKLTMQVRCNKIRNAAENAIGSRQAEADMGSR